MSVRHPLSDEVPAGPLKARFEALQERIQSLETEKKHTEAVLAAIGDGIKIIDRSLTIVYQNSSHKRMFGDLVGTPCYTVTGIRTTYCDECHMASFFECGSPITVERPYVIQGEERHFEINISPLLDETGTVTAAIQVVREITLRKHAEEQLKDASKRDALTGLFNRQFFSEQLDRLKQAQSFPLGFVIIDMDDLKLMNDKFGHNAGDALLRQSSVLLKESFRSDDVVARIGGDEFAILLPRVEEADLMQIVSRIRDHLRERNRREFIKLDLSIGVAIAESADEVEEALNLADQKMYQDKIDRTGRAPRYHISAI